MAVAARGAKKENFEERRYHHRSKEDDLSADYRDWEKRLADSREKKRTMDRENDISEDPVSNDSFQVTIPSPTLSKRHQMRGASASAEDGNMRSDPDQQTPTSASDTNDDCEWDSTSGRLEEPQTGNTQGDVTALEARKPDRIRHKPSEAFSGETLHTSESKFKASSPDLPPHPTIDSENPAAETPDKTSRQRRRIAKPHISQQLRKKPYMGTLTRHVPKNGRHNDEEEEEEEIGVHMWENGKGGLVLDVPWFNPKVEAA